MILSSMPSLLVQHSFLFLLLFFRSPHSKKTLSTERIWSWPAPILGTCHFACSSLLYEAHLISRHTLSTPFLPVKKMQCLVKCVSNEYSMWMCEMCLSIHARIKTWSSPATLSLYSCMYKTASLQGTFYYHTWYILTFEKGTSLHKWWHCWSKCPCYRCYTIHLLHCVIISRLEAL